MSLASHTNIWMYTITMHCIVYTYWCNLYSNLSFILAWIFRYYIITSIIAICLIIPVESIAKVNEFMNLKNGPFPFTIFSFPMRRARKNNFRKCSFNDSHWFFYNRIRSFIVVVPNSIIHSCCCCPRCCSNFIDHWRWSFAFHRFISMFMSCFGRFIRSNVCLH